MAELGQLLERPGLLMLPVSGPEHGGWLPMMMLIPMMFVLVSVLVVLLIEPST